MKKLFILLVLFSFSFASFSQDGEWIELFNGTNLDGWRISENPGSFTVVDKTIKVDGPRGHAFYDGPVGNHDFKNFELMVEVKTMPKANSGIFIHTEFQESGWPNKATRFKLIKAMGIGGKRAQLLIQGCEGDFCGRRRMVHRACDCERRSSYRKGQWQSHQ